jgi:hypothetical protein
MTNAKENFIEKFKAARAAFVQSLAGLDEAEASATSGPAGHWPSIKDIIGNVASWEREVIIADEMLKRGEESHLAKLYQDIDGFNAVQSSHRRSWSYSQVRTELDLNYEALLMAWDEYEGEDGPFGPATWQRTSSSSGSLWWMIHHLVEHGEEIAGRRGLHIEFPEGV